jgi:hypothetical protein
MRRHSTDYLLEVLDTLNSAYLKTAAPMRRVVKAYIDALTDELAAKGHGQAPRHQERR